MRKSRILFVILALMMPVMLLGCAGDDGSLGAQGVQGVPGPPGPPGPGGTASPESCAVCHSSVASIHAATGVVSVSGIAQALVGGNLVVNFNIKVDGVNNDSFTPLYRGYVNFDNAALQTTPPSLITTFQRNTITSNVTLASIGAGNYTITVPAANVINDSNYLFVLTVGGVSHSGPVLEATVNVQYGAAHLRDLVSSDACASCHGPYPVRTEKFPHYRVGGAECQICHSQATRATAFISKNAAGAFVSSDNVYGTNLTEYVHGIHNSHNMPDGVYYRTTAADGAFTTEDRYSIGFPSNMRNCKVCHKTASQLATVAAAPVSNYLCKTCHNNWDGFVRSTGTLVFTPASGIDWHRTFPDNVDCMSTAGCHGVAGARFNEASDFHNSFDSTAQGTNSFYRGTDISFDNPNQVSFNVTGVTKAGDNVTFTWAATKNGLAVNPCNTDINAGPTFRNLGAYLAYAKGDDWVNENVGTSPGQPLGARNFFTSLSTTCAANVATTTGLRIAAGTSYATKAVLAIGGKALDKGGLVPANDNAFFVRVPSPTYAFSMTDGSAVAARRNAVNTLKCLECHRGSLYQHGGDRVDNEQLCVICHNPSSNDKSVRQVTWRVVNADNTVNTDATYDGKVGETYDMRTMLHSIHGVSKRTYPWVVYRSRGIYAFPPPVYEEIGGDLFERAYPKPTGWPAPGDNTIYGSTNGGRITHNWTVVHYPKPPSECLACHNAGAYEAPDQTKAVALTVDPGTSFPVQSDDIVIGPTAAACTACHASAPVRTHANQFGYRTNVTKDEMLILAQP